MSAPKEQCTEDKPGNHLSDRLGPQAVQQYACKSRYWSSSFCRASGPHQHIGVVYSSTTRSREDITVPYMG